MKQYLSFQDNVTIITKRKSKFKFLTGFPSGVGVRKFFKLGF